MTAKRAIKIEHLGLCEYQTVWRSMQTFTAQRTGNTTDQCWFLEHKPVFTLGLNGKREHLLTATDIPVVHADRGGQITYHGPGQLVMYLLLDIKRLDMGVQRLVQAMESLVIDWLAEQGVAAESRRDAPGVYVQGAKLASLGLRIKQGCSYHGLCLNVDMDLEPFASINPCGFAGMPVTQLSALGIKVSIAEIADALQSHLLHRLGYTITSIK